MSHMFSIKVQLAHDTAAINVFPFDTPLQLAYKFCQQYKLDLSQFKVISNSIVGIVKVHLPHLDPHVAAQLTETFQRYLTPDSQDMPLKDIYTLDDLLQQFSFRVKTEPPPIFQNQLYEKILQEESSFLNKQKYDPPSNKSTVCESREYRTETKPKTKKKSASPMTSLQKSIQNLSKSPIKYKDLLKPSKTPTKKSNSPVIHRTKISYFQNTPEKKVHELLHKLIYGKKNRAKADIEDCARRWFKSMDKDRVGFITKDRIELKNVSEDVIAFLYPILWEMEKRKLRVREKDFLGMAKKEFEKLNPEEQEKILLNS